MAYIVLDLANETEEVLSSGKCCAMCDIVLKAGATYTAGASQICTDCMKQEAAKYQGHVQPRTQTY